MAPAETTAHPTLFAEYVQRNLIYTSAWFRSCQEAFGIDEAADTALLDAALTNGIGGSKRQHWKYSTILLTQTFELLQTTFFTDATITLSVVAADP